ncbi:MAG: hypothetical protein V4517_28060 [Pseudomonadota bacterium]
MTPQGSTTVAAACYPAVVIAAWAVVSFGGMGSPRIDSAAAAHAVDRLAPALAANLELAAAPRTTVSKAVPKVALSYAAVGDSEVAAAAEFVTQPLTETTPAPEAPRPIVVAALGDAAEVLSATVPPAQTPANMADPQPQDVATAAEVVAQPVAAETAAPEKPQPVVVAALTDPAEVLPTETAPAQDATATTLVAKADRIELVGECMVAEACIDQFLWALYQRTPKEDTIKEKELRKVQIKRKGKMVTVTRSFTKLVENDFTWKDPHAAERVGMSMIDYVIGGMDRSFKLKLFHTLYAAEAAGLQPGITSAFRDDYRQGIASGLKAASNRSYHGGSLRGGYGRGLAADIVSVNGANRAQRWASTETLWKWVDANGKPYGIGRPYLRFDPPHVGPIDGPEYVSRRGGTKVAAADVKKRHRHAHAHVAHARPAAAKRQVAATSSNSKPTARVAEAR